MSNYTSGQEMRVDRQQSRHGVKVNVALALTGFSKMQCKMRHYTVCELQFATIGKRLRRGPLVV